MWLQLEQQLSRATKSPMSTDLSSLDPSIVFIKKPSTDEPSRSPPPPGMAKAQVDILALFNKAATISEPSSPTVAPPGMTTSLSHPPPENDPLAGIMTEGDVGHVHRVQLAQLVHTNDSRREDYYYHTYTRNYFKRDSKKQGEDVKSSNFLTPLYLPLPVVPDRFLNKPPKPTSLSLQGALGKIPIPSVRRPKQSLVLDNLPSLNRVTASTCPRIYFFCAHHTPYCSLATWLGSCQASPDCPSAHRADPSDASVDRRCLL